MTIFYFFMALAGFLLAIHSFYHAVKDNNVGKVLIGLGEAMCAGIFFGLWLIEILQKGGW
jgi:hypothetical protein